jgi:hypothetical protein
MGRGQVASKASAARGVSGVAATTAIPEKFRKTVPTRLAPASPPAVVSLPQAGAHDRGLRSESVPIESG